MTIISGAISVPLISTKLRPVQNVNVVQVLEKLKNTYTMNVNIATRYLEEVLNTPVEKQNVTYAPCSTRTTSRQTTDVHLI
jgi:hypothetical protein